jgi:hypothetical protein
MHYFMRTREIASMTAWQRFRECRLSFDSAGTNAIKYILYITVLTIIIPIRRAGSKIVRRLMRHAASAPLLIFCTRSGQCNRTVAQLKITARPGPPRTARAPRHF